MKICEFCFNEFEPKVSYQIYCDKQCREFATRQKIADRYQLKRIKKRKENPRSCKGGCGTILSIYNETGRCNSCTINKRQLDKALKSIRNYFEYSKE